MSLDVNYIEYENVLLVNTPILFATHVSLCETAFGWLEKGYSAMKIRWWVHAVIEARKR
jgi:hypothetical protein